MIIGTLGVGGILAFLFRFFYWFDLLGKREEKMCVFFQL
jgi:hypothetical protein